MINEYAFRFEVWEGMLGFSSELFEKLDDTSSNSEIELFLGFVDVVEEDGEGSDNRILLISIAEHVNFIFFSLICEVFLLLPLF